MPSPTGRDRDELGRPRQARPRDRLGRPLPYGSTGVPPLPDVALPPVQAIEAARQLAGEGRFFAAHEVLEARWKAGPEEERELWQGLAQLCVALTHAARGNERGARTLLDRARSHLSDYAAGAGPTYGVDLLSAVAWASTRITPAGEEDL